MHTVYLCFGIFIHTHIYEATFNEIHVMSSILFHFINFLNKNLVLIHYINFKIMKNSGVLEEDLVVINAV